MSPVIVARDRAEACRSKKRYTERRARSTAAFLSTKSLWPLIAYECSICGKWHVTHAQSTSERAILEDLAAQRRTMIEQRLQPHSYRQAGVTKSESRLLLFGTDGPRLLSVKRRFFSRDTTLYLICLCPWCLGLRVLWAAVAPIS